MTNDKCRICANYMSELDTCKYCHFEYDTSYTPFRDDDWDILNLKEEDGWEHIQIIDRLHYKHIDCYSADIWYGDKMAYLIGCYASEEELSRVLGLHKESIYRTEHGLVILNLYQEKCIRNDNH